MTGKLGRGEVGGDVAISIFFYVGVHYYQSRFTYPSPDPTFHTQMTDNKRGLESHCASAACLAFVLLTFFLSFFF